MQSRSRGLTLGLAVFAGLLAIAPCPASADCIDDVSHAARIVSVAADGSAWLGDGSADRILPDGFTDTTGVVTVRVWTPLSSRHHPARVIGVDRERVQIRAVPFDGQQTIEALHVGELVELGEATNEINGSTTMAAGSCISARVEGELSTELLVRGLVATGGSGTGDGGLVGSMILRERLPGSLFVRADVGPVGFASGYGPGIFTGQAQLAVGFDSNIASIGLSGGAMSLNDGHANASRSFMPTMGVVGRLAIDDVASLEVRIAFMLLDGSVDFANAEFALRIGGRRLMFITRGGDSEGGIFYAESGPSLLVGPDGPGSVRLEAALGVSSLWFHPGCAYGACAQVDSAVGPSFMLGLEVRALP